MIVDIFNCSEKYGVIYTDPPWQQGKGGKKRVRPNSSGGNLDYPTMSMEDIKEMHKHVLSELTTPKHNVFMWTINKYLIETQKMMEDLGYVLHARIVWNKLRGPCPAYTLRHQTEYLLWFYRKGCILLPEKHAQGKYADIMQETTPRHSQKPQAAYEMLEDMFPNTNKLEMFARNARAGWDCWGNEMVGDIISTPNYIGESVRC